MKKSLIITILSYIVFFGVLFLGYKKGFFVKYQIYFILIFVSLVIKDILLYFVDLDKKYNKKFDLKRLLKDYSKGRLGIIDFVLILNRNIIFPTILILYMIYLLIGQTHLWGIDKKSLFLWFNQNYLLGITIISGILTIFKENKDEKYFYEELEGGFFSKNIILIILLSLFGTYIIFNQVVKLGNLAYIISIISGILIFLVGISILEDDDTLES